MKICWKIVICLRIVVIHETQAGLGSHEHWSKTVSFDLGCLKSGFKLRSSETHTLDVTLGHEMQVRTRDLELMWIKTKSCSAAFVPGADIQGYEQKTSKCEK